MKIPMASSFHLGGEDSFWPDAPRQKPTVLIAEDNVEMVLLLNRALRPFASEYTAYIVPNGIGVIQYLSHLGPYGDRHLFPAPEILLLDAQLPLMDGFEVLRTIRSNHAFENLPVVLISDWDDPERVEHAYEVGATSYVLKPLTLNALSSLLAEILARKGRFHEPPHPVFFRPRIVEPVVEDLEHVDI